MRALTSALAGLALATSTLHAQTNGMADYQKSKYGFFVHFVWGGGPGTQFTKDRAGKQPATFDEFAASFDATGFANDLDRWGVATRATDDSIEYLHILTPPAGGAESPTLPPPADGKRFDNAVLLAGKKAVTIKLDEAGVSASGAPSPARRSM